MSFWAGVVQGVKDVDVLKEKEALADERQGVRDQENAYRARMAGIQQTQWAATNARLEEQWAFEKVGMGQSVRDAANGLGIGGSPAGGGGGGGSVPTPDAIKDSGVKFGGWYDTQRSDENNSQEDVDYLDNVRESFVNPKDAHEYWSVITGIRETTGQMPTVAQLRASVSVTQIPGYADNKAKAVETLASINNMDMSTPEGLAQATTLYNQLKRIDLNAATIDADLSGFLTEEDLGNLHTRQVGILDTELATNWLSVEDKSELDLAEGVSKDILMGDFRRKYGPQALEALTGLYPQQFSRYAGNPAFRDIVRGPSSATPTQNGGTDEDAASQAQLAEEEERAAALVADPNNPVVLEQALEALGRDEVERLLYPTRFTPSTSATPGELSGGPFTIDVEPLELPEGTLPSLEGLTPDDAGLLRKVGDVVYELQVSPFGMEWVKPTAPSGPASDQYEGYSLEGARMGADDVASSAPRMGEGKVHPSVQADGQKLADALLDPNTTPEEGERMVTEFDKLHGEGAAETVLQDKMVPVEDTSSRGRNLDADNLTGFDPGQTPLDDRMKSDRVSEGFNKSAGEEELTVGVEAIVEGLITDTINQAELESLIKELEEKFTQEKVQQALVLAMSQQQQ